MPTINYFLDCEFVEDGQTIQLLSIGIIAEDGRELYLQTERAAFYHKYPEQCPHEWIRNNVVPSLDDSSATRSEMQEAIVSFVYGTDERPTIEGYLNTKPKFWGYYADYDHVALCQLFGTMMDLPQGFPMYTRDLKQTLDELGNPNIPPQVSGEHNALNDAKWIKNTYLWLEKHYQHPAFTAQIESIAAR